MAAGSAALNLTIKGFKMDIKELLALLVYVVGLGMLAGRQVTDTKYLKKENSKREEEIKEFRLLFLTADQEPKYVSYAAHDKLQAACHNMIMLQINHIKEDQAQIKEGQARIEELLLARVGDKGFWDKKAAGRSPS